MRVKMWQRDRDTPPSPPPRPTAQGQDQGRPEDSTLSISLARVYFPPGLFAGTWGLKLEVPSKADRELHYKRVVFPLVDK